MRTDEQIVDDILATLDGSTFSTAVTWQDKARHLITRALADARREPERRLARLANKLVSDPNYVEAVGLDRAYQDADSVDLAAEKADARRAGLEEAINWIGALVFGSFSDDARVRIVKGLRTLLDNKTRNSR